MKRSSIFFATAIVATVLALAGCSGSSQDDGPSKDTEADAGLPDVDQTDTRSTSADGCTPKSCDDVACGTGIDDGCGGTIDCGACDCDPSSYMDDCPTRPCEVATGCTDNGACEYAPIRCDGNPCECAGDSCDDSELRACGQNACNGSFCDPAPTEQSGEPVYQNECVAPPSGKCGPCDLGTQSCSMNTIACAGSVAQVPPRGDPGQFECDSSSPSSTFLYVDPSYAGGSGDGSREAPYTDLEKALAEAKASAATAIIIGGSPTFEYTLNARSGVSVYGGFENYPSFKANSNLQPTIAPETSQAKDGAVVGVDASGLDKRTVISGIAVENPDLRGESGLSTFGIYAHEAPKLVLHEVDVDANHAATGVTPEDGRRGRNGSDGEDGDDGKTTSSLCAINPTKTPAAGGKPGGSLGCRFTANRTRGNGGAGGKGDGGAADGGEDSQAGTPGGYEAPGEDGDFDGSAEHGENASSASLSIAAGRYPQPRGSGTPGQPGDAGRGGGGGSSGVGESTTSINKTECKYAGDGGGGGGGGCGGEAGEAGGPGGWSIGLVAAQSNGIVIRDVAIASGDGGKGGVGGIGGPGGRGGLGGARGTHPDGGDLNGYHGGAGAQGDRGGHGGSGAGGSSYAVWCDGSTTVTTDGTNELSHGTAGDGGGKPVKSLDRTPPVDGESGEMENCN